MTRQTIDLRSWILIAISFALGVMVADFVDCQSQEREDASSSAVVSHVSVIDAHR